MQVCLPPKNYYGLGCVSDPYSIYSDPDPARLTNADPDPTQSLKLANFFQIEIKFYVFIKLSHFQTIVSNVIVSNMLLYTGTRLTFYSELSVVWVGFPLNLSLFYTSWIRIRIPNADPGGN
jgi:hypothetical protein